MMIIRCRGLTTVFRCEGACHGLHSCVPLTTEERRISVMLGKCGLSVGKCDKVRLMIVMMMMMT